jgi:hypothetical protein
MRVQKYNTISLIQTFFSKKFDKVFYSLIFKVVRLKVFFWIAVILRSTRDTALGITPPANIFYRSSVNLFAASYHVAQKARREATKRNALIKPNRLHRRNLRNNIRRNQQHSQTNGNRPNIKQCNVKPIEIHRRLVDIIILGIERNQSRVTLQQ